METNAHNHTALRLQELSNSDFEIADHQPDITGWELIDEAGNELGEVEDLIFDKEAAKVRYLISNVDLLGDGGSRLVLIPIGIVNLAESEDEVIIPEPYTEYLSTLPTYQKGTIISPAEELAIRYAFLGNEGLAIDNDASYEAHPEDFYNHGHFNDERFIR